MAHARGPERPVDALADPTGTVERIVREVEAGWDHREGHLEDLLGEIRSVLADRAEHELRQVLAQLTTDLELMRLGSESTPSEAERFDRMLAAIERATDLVGTHLGRNEVAKRIIHVRREPLDAAELLADVVARTPGGSRIQMELTYAPIEGDPTKLESVFGHLVERFLRDRDPGAEVRAQLEAREDVVEGLVGVDPAPTAANDLVDELDAPLDIGAYGLDLPYARAVIERHGGTLFVDRFGDQGLGLRFVLPRAQPGGGSP